jgi:hypothetical protein
MFSNPESKLDLFAEMNAGKVILIHTAKDLLKETGTQIFGRFFIALIAQAAQERATLLKEERKPCFVYIDEAQEYFDQNVTGILEQARKQSVAICAANQHLGQLSAKLLDSFAANTSIKMVGGCSEKDARTFAQMMRCTADMILSQPKGHFMTSIRNEIQRPVSLQIPLGWLEGMRHMTKYEEELVRAKMRERYAARPGIILGDHGAPGTERATDSTAAAPW